MSHVIYTFQHRLTFLKDEYILKYLKYPQLFINYKEFKDYKLLLNISIFIRIEEFIVIVRVLTALRKHHDQKQLEKERAYLTDISQVAVY